MNVGTIVMLVFITVLLGYGIALYNGLVTLKHNVLKAWANIDVLLKQRHDELPKLVEICRQYMHHEQDTLVQVTAARAAVFGANQRHDVTAVGAGEGSLRKRLGQLYAVAESYADLKADKQFKHLRERITTLEHTIAEQEARAERAESVGPPPVDVIGGTRDRRRPFVISTAGEDGVIAFHTRMAPTLLTLGAPVTILVLWAWVVRLG